MALLMLGGAHAVAASKAPVPAAGALPAPSVAVAPPVPGCGPRRTMRGAIRFEAPPTC
ncbi:hypothetical protein JQC91_07385 [Jannaschia sp. Os4]|uniref:hypothetical protein n=1 Tax=Jannaschia sp. Os4 TaxID=2807617 RepID=UPI00193A2125|nr:hypothetical protein [Jannaschia sp. Os4]MBM2576124.1 hypothetical protein [Jannaschia sp. Os4]